MRSKQLFFYHFVVVLFSMANTLQVMAQNYFFNHYQVEQGLSNNAVISILQDKRGFMWFGTKDGLNRFDGYKFKVFQANERVRGSIGNNAIYSLKEDRTGILWIGTEEGLYKYDPAYEKFALVVGTQGIRVKAICEDKQNNLWFISDFSLLKFNKITAKITNYHQPDAARVTDICCLANGELWISGDDGAIRRFDRSSNSFSAYNLLPPHFEGDKLMLGLQEVENGQILILNHDYGISLFDTQTHKIKTIKIPNRRGQKLFLRTFLKVSDKEIWIASEFGVFIYYPSTGKFSNLQKKYDDPYSLSDNAVHSLFKDREGGVWVGTYFGGLNYYPSQNSLFEKYSPRVSENSISGNVVRELKEDRSGNIWIGTEDAGLNKFNPQTGLFTHFFAGGSDATISHNNVHALLVSGDSLWVGTFQNGLDILDIRSGKVIRKYKEGAKSGLKSNFVYSLYKTRNGKKLAGTTNGLYYFDKKRDRFELMEGFPTGYWYASIIEDTDGGIYAGTFGKGLFYYHHKTKRNAHFSHSATDSGSLSNNWVNVCFEDSKRNLWLGTNNGLCRLDKTNGKMLRYGIKQVFPGNYILSIKEDDRGALWISTTKGIVRFYPATGAVEVFTKSEGLLSDQFNFGSSLKASDGKLYFGSVKGLIAFNPDKLRNNSRIPPVFITALEVNNMNILAGNETGILKKNISFTDSIILDNEHSNLNLELAALQFTSPQTLKYAFKLEGLSQGWTFMDQDRKVFFTRIPAGTYVFKAKVRNNFGSWGQAQKLLTIKVLPPWWKSNIALVLYSIFSVLLLVLGFTIYHKQVELTNQRKMEKLAVAKEKEMLDSKMEFFINVAHEIRTPLTLIRVPLPRVMRATQHIPEIAKSVETISKNTERLIELTNQLLDLRQTEVSKFRLNFKKDNIRDILEKACESFSTLAEQNNIRFSLELPPSPVYAFTDLDSINKIVFNLLSNAVKYAETQVEVRLKSNEAKGSYLIEIRNDGALISPEFKEKIFEPFFRMKHHERYNGTGIGLSLARSLAELFGGELTYDIESGFNLFSLTLPYEANKIDD